MSRHDLLPALLGRLMAAACFEDAATAALEAILACAEEAIAKSRFATSARLLRAVVHLRPSDGYQRLFGIEHRTRAQVEGTGYLTSANVWRWVAEHRCAVSIDVQLGGLHAWLPDGSVVRHEPQEAAGVPGYETRQRMLGRDATHVHVVPLRTPGGGVGGMIALEAHAKAAIGREFVWGDCEEQLELVASAAAPYLGALPPRPVQGAQTDALLPVVGRATAGLIEVLRVFAQQEETVLVSGPTGTGKSRLARWCHEQSQRKGKPFETLDLLSVPEELQMAELFGWKRGAFTGATKDSAGAIARASQGTLFIDEIDKLSLKAQAGMLRVLEERRYRPLGDEGAEQRADVRFVVGTNADLRAQVRAGKFREDLYYRINVLPVRLSALAERLDELPLWAEYMLGRRHEESGGGAVRLAREAIELLTSVPWPGNLRQLDNIIRRAYAISLSDRGGVGNELVLARRHVERALAYDASPETGAFVEQLWRAASAFVQEAERRGPSAGPLSLDMADAFRGLVLVAAVQRRGRDDAFVLLGQQQLLKNRNHHRALKRELERVRELLRVVGGDVDPALVAALDAAEESGEGR
ncbi:sigma-54-dependent transcriptional regulator [Polyangium mundeleinium]|uniref:Sigma 54-interacting transcriptional regulator n=1 Tax=Polyangium mundeleinium TaxID=2995306 RepID=A0ABT5F3G2_9BACT|nr:sigma 54-interacting transcriptional regulator [Polyangium mundeleinium]MDC0748637.1 sigma 54-interacting transcriptional regulator [Polyangium mundeleinium]